MTKSASGPSLASSVSAACRVIVTVRVTVTLTWCVGRRELSGVPSRRLVSSNVQGTAAVRRSQLILRQHQQMAIRSRQQARSLKVTATKSASELSTASTESVARRPTATVRATGTTPWTATRRGLSTARHRPLVSPTVRRTADVLQECSSPGGGIINVHSIFFNARG